ncbi:DUF4097 family beta strand repeat-containing protein [Phreatobacter stygius]|uniref:DUF4097 domain-containing protein n=1 Tax=Phreatobacter stygius TaxID=1940610 RepID=A0A4D7ATU3_9HYPH|nr:DUF4097 family beta strand repeat-containing protein [Phreatobacter stygius]QCI62961.1 DUF4097 domain-containing protein [Phreatobacter stygius]
MPIFPTPDPITVTIDLFVADVRITASERADTSVEVRPRDQGRSADVKAVERIQLEHSDGRLLIKGPRRYFHLGIGRREAVDVTIELPAGSHLFGEVGLGGFRAEGRLGECRIKTGSGDINLERTGALSLDTGIGNIVAGHAAGDAHIATGTGAVSIGGIDGKAAIKNSNGATKIGEITGYLQLSAANGDISVGRAHAAVVAKTANGNVRVDEIMRGSVVLETACGEVEVGIREGTAVWLDVSSKRGTVRNSLEAHDGPAQSDETAEVRARTAYGDIVIRRSAKLISQAGGPTP